MKAVVFILVLLAALKLGHQEYLYRAATREVIVATYRDRAALACQSDGRNAALGIAPHLWAGTQSVQLTIGKSGLDVHVWQVDSPLWAARFRHPFLVLTPGSRSGQVYCEYDIVNAVASVHRM